jgi:hypothetical protein
LPLASRATAVSVCDPFDVVVVFHGDVGGDVARRQRLAIELKLAPAGDII